MELSATVSDRAKARIGQTLGKYRLDSLLGLGGMAAVYGATAADGAPVAIKLVHPELMIVPTLGARFVREAYLANHIAHPGVPSVLEHGDDHGLPYIVMERLDGETLEALWERRGCRLPAGQVVAVTERVLDILAAAHAKGVVHRDVKPENVFLTSDGDLKVLDFGIARLLDGSGATASGELMGTPAFMPPEQASGHAKTADGRSDLWSVGAVMFTLIVGDHVHPAKSATLQLILAATQRARSIGSVVPTLPHKLVTLVDRALAYDRADRWESAKQMLSALRSLAHESIPPTEVAPPRTKPETQTTLPLGAMKLPSGRPKGD